MSTRYWFLTAAVGLGVFLLIAPYASLWIAGFVSIWLSCLPAFLGVVDEFCDPADFDHENYTAPAG